ncbi:Hypothetical predicted protein [Octopus vulgaris]|uniref:Uncharacterized protein n=1 Tax=Octopus vulgaris TaxID=6645 RepID=A0AA36AS83_OCTVU|nr:Hypothetical predicted protein [Octopus vulgaris]
MINTSRFTKKDTFTIQEHDKVTKYLIDKRGKESYKLRCCNRKYRLYHSNVEAVTYIISKWRNISGRRNCPDGRTQGALESESIRSFKNKECSKNIQAKALIQYKHCRSYFEKRYQSN